MFTITARFLEPVYEAAVDGEPEWPPHPARLLSALVAAAGDDADGLAAVRSLEDRPPVVRAPEARPATLHAYVPTNAVGATKSNRPARTSDLRSWARSHLRQPVVQFSWDADVGPQTLAVLASLCRKVPYLGRASSQVLLDVYTAVDPELDVLVPGAGRHRLRVGWPGYVDALRTAYDLGEPAHSVRRSEFYGPPSTEVVGGLPSPAPAYPDLLTRAFPAGARIEGRLALRVTQAWKKAVLQRLGARHGPEELELLHGHHDGSRRQCAFLAFPFVGHPHATGELLGVGVAVSPDLPAGVRRSLLAIFGLVPNVPALDALVVAGLGRFGLVEADDRRSVDPLWWCGPSSTWASALPVLPDRYPDNLAEAGAMVADGCEMAGYPRPSEVELLPGPPVQGGVYLRRADTRRPGSPPRPRLHVRLHFDADVSGPVVVGHLRHLGLGLFAPDGTKWEAS